MSNITIKKKRPRIVSKDGEASGGGLVREPAKKLKPLKRIGTPDFQVSLFILLLFYINLYSFEIEESLFYSICHHS